jgi:hypothetical protein
MRFIISLFRRVGNVNYYYFNIYSDDEENRSIAQTTFIFTLIISTVGGGGRRRKLDVMMTIGDRCGKKIFVHPNRHPMLKLLTYHPLETLEMETWMMLG